KATTKDFLVVRQEGAWQVRWGAFAKADPNNPHDVLMQKRVRSLRVTGGGTRTWRLPAGAGASFRPGRRHFL
ncbi:MAG: hypothetical protein KBF29_08330, partial [Sterolibacterium sp.]|nr:hypothetical protein [Sterolibacterium sp.]